MDVEILIYILPTLWYICVCEERLKCVCVPKKKKKTQVCVKKDSSVRVCVYIFFIQITKGFDHSTDIKRPLGAISFW